MLKTLNSLSALADGALDRSIALGYGRPGLQARRRLPGWPPDPPRIDGATVLVTGAAAGIGLAAARGLAALGARVLAVARNQQRAGDAERQIKGAVPGAEVRGLACDVSSLAALRDLTDQLAAEEPRLNALVHNAGLMPPRRQRSAEGHELMFATHVLASFALIDWCREALARGAPSRVILVSSGGMYGARVPEQDPESELESYSPKRLYARTKREQVVIGELWAERLQGSGIVVHSMHPGWVDTGGLADAMPGFRLATRPLLRTLQEGADTIVWLAASPQALQGPAFWQDRRPRPTRYRLGAGAEPERARRHLWEYCESIVGRYST